MFPGLLFAHDECKRRKKLFARGSIHEGGRAELSCYYIDDAIIMEAVVGVTLSSPLHYLFTHPGCPVFF